MESSPVGLPIVSFRSFPQEPQFRPRTLVVNHQPSYSDGGVSSHLNRSEPPAFKSFLPQLRGSIYVEQSTETCVVFCTDVRSHYL